MKFSEAAKAAVKFYVEEAGVPKGFTNKDEQDFKIYLGLLFHMELESLKEKDLSKDDRAILENGRVFKDVIKHSTFKTALNEGTYQKAKEISAAAGESKKKSKSKSKKHKKHRHVVEVESAPAAAPVVYQNESLITRAKNFVLGKMLDASIAINDWLIEH